MKNISLLTLVSLLFLCSITNAQDNCPPEIGTNLGEFRTALVDIFKSSRDFWETDPDNFVWDTGEELAIDINGYPTSVNSGEGRAARTLIWEALEGNYPTGIYTLLYDGIGTIELGMDAVNPVFTDNGNINNQITFEVNTPTNEGIMVDITSSNPSDYIRNIRIIRPDEAGTNYVNTFQDEPFIDLFYDRHQYFQSVRFMDWMTTNWSVYSTWSQRPTLHKSNWAIHEAATGVPVEIMVHVANRLGADPWFCMPHRANDDYMIQFATYVRDNLDTDLKVSIEYSNEVWNDLFSSYDDFNGQHNYALDMGTANGITGYYERIGYWVARRSGEMFDIFETVFGGNDRLVKVIPIQTGPDLATPHTLDYMHNETPLHEIGDVVAGAAYFGGEYDRDALNSMMTATQLLDDLAANMYADDSGPYWCLETIDMLNAPPYAASNLQFVAYEGGQHLANPAGTPEDDATTILIEANRHPQMGAIYSDYYDWWASNGGGAFMAFTSIAEPSMFGAWGLLENIQQDPTTAPKWLATTQWIQNNPCTTTPLATIALDFQVTKNNTTNRLEWQINTLDNIAFFAIDKLENDEWNEIGRVENNNKKKEQFIDKYPLIGLNIYRLQVINNEGTTIIEKIVQVNHHSIQDIQLFPSIVDDVTYLSINKNLLSTITSYQIFNNQGQLIKNNGKILNSLNQLTMNDLEAGIYFIRIEDSQFYKSIKFIKR